MCRDILHEACSACTGLSGTAGSMTSELTLTGEDLHWCQTGAGALVVAAVAHDVSPWAPGPRLLLSGNC